MTEEYSYKNDYFLQAICYLMTFVIGMIGYWFLADEVVIIDYVSRNTFVIELTFSYNPRLIVITLIALLMVLLFIWYCKRQYESYYKKPNTMKVKRTIIISRTDECPYFIPDADRKLDDGTIEMFPGCDHFLPLKECEIHSSVRGEGSCKCNDPFPEWCPLEKMELK